MRARSIVSAARSPVLQSQATANFPGPSGRVTSFQPVPWQNWQFSSGIVERAYGRARRTARVGRCGILCKKKIKHRARGVKRRKVHRGEKDLTQREAEFTEKRIRPREFLAQGADAGRDN